MQYDPISTIRSALDSSDREEHFTNWTHANSTSRKFFLVVQSQLTAQNWPNFRGVTNPGTFVHLIKFWKPPKNSYLTFLFFLLIFGESWYVKTHKKNVFGENRAHWRLCFSKKKQKFMEINFEFFLNHIRFKIKKSTAFLAMQRSQKLTFWGTFWTNHKLIFGNEKKMTFWTIFGFHHHDINHRREHHNFKRRLWLNS